MTSRMLWLVPTILALCQAAVILNNQPQLPNHALVNYLNPGSSFGDARQFAPNFLYPASPASLSGFSSPQQPAAAFGQYSQLPTFGANPSLIVPSLEDSRSQEESLANGAGKKEESQVAENQGISHISSDVDTQVPVDNGEALLDQQQSGQVLVIVPESMEELLILTKLTEALRASGAAVNAANTAANEVDNDAALVPAPPTLVTQARVNSKSPAAASTGSNLLPAQPVDDRFQARSSLPNSFPFNSLFPTVSLDLQTLGLSVGTAANFPQPTAATGSATIIDAAADTTATVTGRAYFHQPSSSSYVYVILSLAGLTPANTYTIQIYTNAQLPLSCAQLGAEYRPGGLTGLVGAFTPTLATYSGAFRALPAATMALLGTNSALSHSIAILNAGTIVACGAIQQTTNV